MSTTRDNRYARDPFSSDRASNARPNECCAETGCDWLFFDYARLSVQPLAGFRVYGRGRLRSRATYCFFPIVNQLEPKKIARSHSFNTRLGECDLYTFANVFADYPLFERDHGHTKLR
jgi:hypothetical protein